MATSPKNTTRKPARRVRPIEVAIVVTRFQPILGSGAGTGFSMRLARPDRRAFVRGDTLVVRRPGGPIRFTLSGGPNDPESYFPTGITFLRLDLVSTTDTQRIGHVNFPQSDIRLEGKSLRIRDAYRDPAKVVHFKFSLLVQRGSDGALGVIDPGIDHDGDN